MLQQFECKLEDLPVVGVACVNEAGERVSCRVEVEWIYAKVSVYMLHILKQTCISCVYAVASSFTCSSLLKI